MTVKSNYDFQVSTIMNLIAYRPPPPICKAFVELFRVILKQNLPSSEAVTCRHRGHIDVQINGVVNYGLRQHGFT